MYLQVMEGVLGDSKKVLLDVNSSSNVLYLPLGGASSDFDPNRMPPVMTPDDQRAPQQSDRTGRTPRSVNRESR
jgi:modulator of FtsH protease HflK